MTHSLQNYFEVMLHIRDYKKNFGSHLVFDIAVLELEQTLYWLQGENGSGKTTFLKSVAGLIPFDGAVELNEVALKKSRRHYTAIVNYAGAEPRYPGFLTGTDLIKFYSGAKGENMQKLKKLEAAFKMDHYLGNKISSYSSGMTKKLSLLLAFIGNPKLILLDEPFTTLDIDAVAALYELIEEGLRNRIMFCISSHQQLMLPPVSLLVQDKTIIRQ